MIDTANYWDLSPIAPPDSINLELYDYKTPGVPRRYWRRQDFSPVSDWLMSLREGLTKDFMRDHKTLEEAVKAKPNILPVLEGREDLEGLDVSGVVSSVAKEHLKSWKNLTIRTVHKKVGRDWTMDRKERFTLYPTASQIISKFHDDMQHAAYSLIEPRSSIERHTGQENRTGEFLRIHIPLIIPEGDLYFECMGEVIYWDDIWGFNNQLTHSAHNNTDEYRLIFLLDLRMSALGLEPCGQFDPKWQLHAKPFIREKQ